MIPTSGVVPMSQNLWTYMVSRYHDLFRVFLGPVPREFLFAPPGASANPKKRDIQDKKVQHKIQTMWLWNLCRTKSPNKQKKTDGKCLDESKVGTTRALPSPESMAFMMSASGDSTSNSGRRSVMSGPQMMDKIAG